MNSWRVYEPFFRAISEVQFLNASIQEMLKITYRLISQSIPDSSSEMFLFDYIVI